MEEVTVREGMAFRFLMDLYIDLMANKARADDAEQAVSVLNKHIEDLKKERNNDPDSQRST